MRRSYSWMAGLAAVFVSFTPGLWPQSSTPQVYSFTADPGMSLMGSGILKVVRDGPRVAVDQSRPLRRRSSI